MKRTFTVAAARQQLLYGFPARDCNSARGCFLMCSTQQDHNSGYSDGKWDRKRLPKRMSSSALKQPDV